ncbi:hypothetical protein BC628DRAFT_1362707, partial [Trametes gibbosa]
MDLKRRLGPSRGMAFWDGERRRSTNVCRRAERHPGPIGKTHEGDPFVAQFEHLNACLVLGTRRSTHARPLTRRGVELGLAAAHTLAFANPGRALGLRVPCVSFRRTQRCPSREPLDAYGVWSVGLRVRAWQQGLMQGARLGEGGKRAVWVARCEVEPGQPKRLDRSASESVQNSLVLAIRTFEVPGIWKRGWV